MRKITYAFALLAALLLSAAQKAKADVVSDYVVDFEKEISTTAHDFKVATGWGHIVSTYEDDWDTGYVVYSWFRNSGVDNSGCLKVGPQTGLGSGWGSGETTTDLLITPAVSGTVTVDVKKYYSSSTIKFYKVTKSGSTYTKGDEISVETSELSTSDYTTLTIPVDDNSYIGIWGNNVYLDNFKASSADVQYAKAMTITYAKNIGGTDAYCDENNDFTITFSATLKNTGDLDLNPGDEGYSLSIVNNSKNDVVVGTKAITKPLAVGETLIDTISVKVSANTYPDRNRYDVKENVSGTKYNVYAWMDVVPYVPVLQLRNSNGTIDSLSTFDYGKVNTATKKSFTIRNKGGKALNVTSISVPEGYSVDVPTPFSVAAGKDSVFNVTILAEAAGEYSGEVVITADEVDRFKFYVKGTVLDPNKWYVTFEDQKIPAGTIAEKNWKVYQIGYASSSNVYGLYHSSSSELNKFISPLLKVGEGEKLTFEAGKASRWTSYGSSGTVNVLYSTDRQNWTTVKALTKDSMSTASGEYNSVGAAKEFVVDSIPAGNYYVAFEGSYVYIDNIYGFTPVEVAHDWMLEEAKLPASGMVNTVYTATATLKNVNTKQELPADYTATLYFNDQPIAAETDTIAGGESGTFTFTYTPHKVGTFDAYVVFASTDGLTQVVSDTVQVAVAEESAASEVRIGTIAQRSSSYATPIVTNYKNSASDAIYTAAKLAEAGLKKGDKISKITYKGYNQKGEKVITLMSWIANETDATFPSSYDFPDTEKMTEIYNGEYTLPNGGTDSKDGTIPLIELSLAEPFVYDGGDIRIFTRHAFSSYFSAGFEVAQDNGHSYGGRSDSKVIDTDGMSSLSMIAVPYFSLVNEPATFSGTVKNAYGEAVAGASVTLTSGDVIYNDTTDAEGAYSMTVIQKSLPYVLTVDAEDYEAYTDADTILVDSVPGKDIVLTLTPSTITLTESEWTTFSAKEPIDFSETDINAYIVTAVSGENATLKRVEKIPARTGVVLLGNGTYTLPAATDAEAIETNLLVATADSAYTVKDEDADKAYTFANNYFSKAVAGDVVAKKHAYLYTEAAASNDVYLVLPQVTVSGTVTDGAKAIAGATVILSDEDGETLELTTDAEGKFSQDLDQTNFKYVITAEAMGYDGYESDSIVALSDTVLTIVLDRQPIVASISSLGWTSFSSIFPVDLAETGLQAYIVTSFADGKATVKAAGTTVPANTGVLLMGEAGDYTLDVADAADALEGNLLVGTAEAPLEITADNYGKVYSFAEVDNAPGFFKDEAGYTIPQGEAYLPVSDSAADEFYALYDPTTGITFVVGDSQLDESLPMYNLAGQRVDKAFHGVVVQNGRKFIRK